MFSNGQLGASFFCSRDFEDRSSLQLIVSTLAIQLARKYPEYRSILVPLVESDPGITNEPLYNQMDRLVVQPLMKSAISTVIIVDALDECRDDEPASAFLTVLGQFVSKIPKVKFFITSRPELGIRGGFRLPLLSEATEILVLHEVEPSRVDNDIRLFFRHEFSEIKGRHELGDWPSEEQLDMLCGRAAGLFVYAVATVKYINTRVGDPRKQLDRLLQSPENSIHEGKIKFEGNTTLDSLYLSILRGAYGDCDPDDDPMHRSVLGAVILATSPLSPSTVAALLGLSTEGTFRCLSQVPSLLILQEDVDRPVRLFHKSFREFITDPTRCTDRRFYVSPLDHHAELLIGCLDLLNRALGKNMCNLPDAVTNDEVENLRERAEQYITCGLRYACESWYKHLVDAHAVPDHTLEMTTVLSRFLEEKFVFWLEVLSVFGTIREAIEALEAAAKWLEVCQFYPTPNRCIT